MNGVQRWPVVAALALLAATPVFAQAIAITAIGNNPDIGNVTAATSGLTEFRVSTLGKVTVASGTGTRQTTADVTNTITITCSGGSNSSSSPCNANNVRIRITPGATQTGRAQAVNDLQVALGTALYASGTSLTFEGTTAVLTIQPVGRGGPGRTIRLGLDLPITGGFGTSGLSTATYTVQAGFSPNVSTSATGTVRAMTRNGTSISKTSDLAFGALLPLSGQTGTVAINATTGARSVTSGTVLLRPGATTSRAVYPIQGEGGQVISVSVPSSFQMTGSGSPITVNVVSTAVGGVVVGDAGGTVTIPGSAGTSGSTELGIGGSFTVTGPMAAGNYSGTFNVVFNWN